MNRRGFLGRLLALPFAAPAIAEVAAAPQSGFISFGAGTPAVFHGGEFLASGWASWDMAQGDSFTRVFWECSYCGSANEGIATTNCRNCGGHA